MLFLKNELKGALILTVLMVIVAVLFWSPETSLFFVSSLGFHEMGHMLPILMLGIPAYLTVTIWGVATVSDSNGRSRLSEFHNGLIHLGGPAFNFVFALVALYLYNNAAGTNEYWLRLANTNALIGFVNILVLGHASDGGKFFRRLYSSMSETLDNLVVIIVSVVSIGVLAIVAIEKGPASVVWLMFIAGWIVFSMFQADGQDDHSEIPTRAMNIVEQAVSLVLYFGLWYALLTIFIRTPFMITHDQAIHILENMIVVSYRVVTNLPAMIMLVLFFLSLTLPHELGHWLVGTIVGIKTNRLVLGTPKGEPWLRFSFAGLSWEMYRMPVMAAVDTSDEDLRKAPLWANAAFSLAGPLVNILLALTALTLSLGLSRAIEFLLFVIGMMIQLVGSFLFGWLGWFGGSKFFFEAFAPINAAAAIHGLSELTVIFVVVQVFVAVVNLLPIPGLDGGWILMNLVIKIKSRFDAPEKIEQASLAVYNAWISFASKRMLKIVIGGTALLSVIHFGLYYFG
jgi:Zn-dependent protease